MSFACHLCPFKTDHCQELGVHLVEQHLHCCSHCGLKSVSKDFIDDHISDSHSELIISSSGSQERSEKENFDVDLPSRKRKAKHLGLGNERNASPLISKVHKRQRTASDKKEDSKQEKNTATCVNPLSPKSHHHSV